MNSKATPNEKCLICNEVLSTIKTMIKNGKTENEIGVYIDDYCSHIENEKKRNACIEFRNDLKSILLLTTRGISPCKTLYNIN